MANLLLALLLLSPAQEATYEDDESVVIDVAAEAVTHSLDLIRHSDDPVVVLPHAEAYADDVAATGRFAGGAADDVARTIPVGVGVADDVARTAAGSSRGLWKGLLAIFGLGAAGAAAVARKKD